jgi:trimeric autotransporter adhesin
MVGFRRTLAVVTALASWSCSSTQPDATTTPVAAIVVSPSSSTLALNAQLPLQALVQDGSGSLVPDASVTWTVENPAIASVSPAGVVTALALGTTQVAASARGKSGVASITVQKTPVASVVVRPNRVDAAIGSSTQLSASTLDASQNTLADRAVIWTTSNAAVATVNATGVVKAVAAGTATITATSEGKSDASAFTIAPGAVARVDVTPASVAMVAGQTQQLAAAAKDASGSVLTGKSVIWASSNAAVATVTSSGDVTAVAQGNATITATVDGVSGSSEITISAAPVGSVIVSPQSPSVSAGATVQLTGTVRDVNGGIVNSAPVWTSSDNAIATVSGTGLVTGVSAGNATITASSGGKTGSTVVKVSAAPIGNVSVSPQAPSMNVGATTQLSANVTDVNGASVSGAVVAWTSSNIAIATVSASGLVTGVSAGTATITASSGGKSGSTTVTVSLVPVQSVAVTPSTSSLTPGQTQQLAATVTDANGSAANRPVSWASSDNAVATVDQAGLVTAVAQGSATITATSGGVSGSAGITVGAVPAASVTVNPGTLSLTVAQTGTLDAVVKDASGNVLTGRSVTWSSSSPLVASVSQSGVVTALIPGTATITAASGSASGTAAVTVNAIPPGPAASITVSPSSLTIKVGDTSTLTAVVKDSQGNTLSGASVTWTTADASRVTVTAGNPSTSATVKGIKTGTNITIRATVTGTSISDTTPVTVK